MWRKVQLSVPNKNSVLSTVVRKNGILWRRKWELTKPMGKSLAPLLVKDESTTSSYLSTVVFRCNQSSYAWRLKAINDLPNCILVVVPQQKSPLRRSWTSTSVNTTVYEPDYGWWLNTSTEEVKIFRILAERYRNRRGRFGLRFNLIAAIINSEITLCSWFTQ